MKRRLFVDTEGMVHAAKIHYRAGTGCGIATYARYTGKAPIGMTPVPEGTPVTCLECMAKVPP